MSNNFNQYLLPTVHPFPAYIPIFANDQNPFAFCLYLGVGCDIERNAQYF